MPPANGASAEFAGVSPNVEAYEKSDLISNPGDIFFFRFSEKKKVSPN